MLSWKGGALAVRHHQHAELQLVVCVGVGPVAQRVLSRKLERRPVCLPGVMLVQSSIQLHPDTIIPEDRGRQLGADSTSQARTLSTVLAEDLHGAAARPPGARTIGCNARRRSGLGAQARIEVRGSQQQFVTTSAFAGAERVIHRPSSSCAHNAPVHARTWRSGARAGAQG